MAQRAFAQVETLRQTTSNPIHFVNYGQVAPAMKVQFHQGRLPDIRELVGFGPDALFRDAKLGHGGRLMHELCALTWLNSLYGAEVDAVKHSAFSPEAAAIVKQANRKNQQYR